MSKKINEKEKPISPPKCEHKPLLLEETESEELLTQTFDILGFAMVRLNELHRRQDIYTRHQVVRAIKGVCTAVSEVAEAHTNHCTYSDRDDES